MVIWDGQGWTTVEANWWRCTHEPDLLAQLKTFPQVKV
jgi:hypothetical protein